MDLGQVREILGDERILGYAQLVWQFPDCGSSDTHLPDFLDLALDAQRVGTTGVGPHGREGDLLVGAFLEEERAVTRAEEEDGKGSMEESLTDV